MFFGSTTIGGWSITYEKAIRDDGTLLFQEKLSHSALEAIRKEQGSYIFANQYLNIIIPDEERRFRPEWIKYWMHLPDRLLNFVFIDPAIGQKDHHDYTAIVVVSVDVEGHWYVRAANRYRLTPSQIIDKVFEVHALYKPQVIGIEVVAYQEALLYILDKEMKLKGVTLPVTGVTRSKMSKETRILQLVPMMEWGRLFIQSEMKDLEDELFTFPRGSHDDLIDSLASLTEFVRSPARESKELREPHSPHSKDYERWMIQQMVKNQGMVNDGYSSDS